MNDAFAPAITALQQELGELEGKVKEIKSAINTLCRHAGTEELYVIEEQVLGNLSAIRADTFYGKTIGTAAREYMEMRKASNLGPTTSKEVYEALVAGGLQFEAANETNAQISVGNTLRKNSKTFHRLPNGQYGLLVWYPNAKTGKSSADTVEEEKTTENVPSTDEVNPNDTPESVEGQGVSEILSTGGR